MSYLDRLREIYVLDGGRQISVHHEQFISGVSERLFIQDALSEQELMLRRFKNQLVIARIAFNHPRQGFGTAVLAILKAECEQANLNTLVVESVISPEMVAFCQKHGFSYVEHPHACAIAPYGTYQLEL